ncbi:AAA family ATPase [Alkaliphilus serpentinus]|nr:AAA family ATPase [Alkaliphilus serpentinus]
MKKINLVLADNDEGYVEAFTNFLLNNYQHQFNVSFFTSRDHLNKFLENEIASIDILLISVDMLSNTASKREIGTIAVLSEIKSQKTYKNYKTIFKYQSGEILVSEVLNILSEGEDDKLFIRGNSSTKITGVYSPIGGGGKTTIAVGLSSLYAKEGKKTLYLNLEDIPSTSGYFDCSTQQNMSNLIYYLKEKDKNLSLKIHNIKAIDATTGIEYIAPCDNLQEMEELLPQDVEYLLSELKISNFFDEIIIDMSSRFCHRNCKLLKLSDEILYITNQSPVFNSKLETLNNLMMIDELQEILIVRKIINIINKYNPNNAAIEDCYVEGQKMSVRIPRINNLLKRHENRFVVKTDNELGYALNSIIKDQS